MRLASNNIKQSEIDKFRKMAKDAGINTVSIIGAAGQVASYLNPVLEKVFGDNLKKYDIAKFATPESGIKPINVLEPSQTQKMLAEDKPDLVINLAALLSGAASKNLKLMDAINSKATSRIMEEAKEAGVKRYYVPSSIGVFGPETEKNAGLEARRSSKGAYGIFKGLMEFQFRKENFISKNTGDDFMSMALRYGGVLTAKIKYDPQEDKIKGPSDGTTEQLDELIVAYAEHIIAEQGGLIKERVFTEKDKPYHPEIYGHHKFPMIDGEDVGIETVRFMLAERDKVIDNAAKYSLGSVSMSLEDVREVCTKYCAEENIKDLQVIYDKTKMDPNKNKNAENWPDSVENAMEPAQQDWGANPKLNTIEIMVKQKLQKAIGERKEMEIKLSRGIDRTQDGQIGVA